MGFGYHIAKDNEIQGRLYDKLDEECLEFKLNPCIEELADIMEVLEAIAKFQNISLREVIEYKKKKKIMAGGFDNKIILEWTKEN